MALELWIPPTAREKRHVRVCTLPGCGMKFPYHQHEDFRRHVEKCAKRNMDQIEAEIARRESSSFQSIDDKEAFEWVRKRQAEGKKATKHGRPA